MSTCIRSLHRAVIIPVRRLSSHSSRKAFISIQSFTRCYSSSSFSGASYNAPISEEHSPPEPVESDEEPSDYQSDGRHGFTIFADPETDITLEDLRQNVRNMVFSGGPGGERRSVLVLVTPRFTTLLNSKDRISSMIAKQAFAASGRTKTLNVILGTVERIPLPTPFTTVFGWDRQPSAAKEHVWGADGISVSNMTTPYDLPDGIPSRIKAAPGTLTVKMELAKSRPLWESAGMRSEIRLSVGLAKMNMITGDDYHLELQKWTSQDTLGLKLAKVSKQRIESYTFGMPIRARRMESQLYVPGAAAVALGMSKRISSVFGNVIKSLESNEDPAGVIPASSEIEKNFPPMLSEFSVLPEIWAYIQPASSVAFSTRPPPRPLNGMDEGACFYRVSGGGGGWDGPGGPVSLEVVDNQFSQEEGASEDDMPDFFSQMSVVKPGDVVTFIAVGVKTATAARFHAESAARLPYSGLTVKLASGPPVEQWKQTATDFGKVTIKDYFAAMSDRMVYRQDTLPRVDGKVSPVHKSGLVVQTRLPSFSFFDTTPARAGHALKTDAKGQTCAPEQERNPVPWRQIAQEKAKRARPPKYLTYNSPAKYPKVVRKVKTLDERYKIEEVFAAHINWKADHDAAAAAAAKAGSGEADSTSDPEPSTPQHSNPEQADARPRNLGPDTR